MTQVTLDMIKELRERTGIGMGKCKEALVAAGGDVEKAIDILRKAGVGAASKKEGREAKEGVILSLEDKDHFVLLEANAETDFVVSNARFQEFVHDSIKQAFESNVQTLDELLSQPYSKDPSLTVDQYRNLVIQSLGENIQLRRYETVKKNPNSSYGMYSHMGGKIVVVVELEGATGQEDAAKDVAMHVAAESPEYVRPEDIPASVIEREESVARAQVEGKPANMIEKIVAGKIKAYTDQFCLITQKFVKDSSKTVAQFVEARGKEIGKPLSVKSFWRWKVGQ